VKDYNENMGFVDKADMLKALYEVNRKSRKWWHRCGAAVCGRNDAKEASEPVFIAMVNDPTLVDPLFLKIEVVCFSEALTIYSTTRHNIPYNMNFYQPCYVNPTVPGSLVFIIVLIMFPRCQHQQLKFDFGWDWVFFMYVGSHEVMSDPCMGVRI